MQLNLTVETWKKGTWYIAKCPELEFISQGKTEEEAKNNLREVIQIQFEEMTELGTLEDYLSECGFKTVKDAFIPIFQKISTEKYAFQVA